MLNGPFISIFLWLILYSPSFIHSQCSGSTCSDCIASRGHSENACYWCNGQCKDLTNTPPAGCTQTCTCNPGTYGPDCTMCTCINGTCDDGAEGSGYCTVCNSSYFGKNCDENCMCVYGTCDQGINGTGFCLSCFDNYYGMNCNQSCTCVNGTCSQGINGTGYCLSCFDNYYGMNCDRSCTCVNGNCSLGVNGSGCICSTPFFGESCDQRCIDSSCTIPCVCDSQETCYGANIVCVNDIVVTNQNFSFLTFSNYSFGGNLSITETHLNINSIELNLQKSLSFSNSTINFNSSSIITSGCINISNTNFTINLSNIEQNLYLLNSTSGCLNGLPNSITYLNQPKCTTLTLQNNAYSLLVVLTKQMNCNLSQQQNTLQPWAIALIIVGIVIGIALIFLLIVFAIPNLRDKIMPHKNNEEIKTV